MARGGYRPGAGRKRKAGSGPSAVRDAAAAIVKNLMVACNATPLDYMLAVMRDPDIEPARRDRMAIAAAPFCHPRVADNRAGKKDEKEAAAKTAGQGSAWGDDLAFSNERPN